MGKSTLARALYNKLRLLPQFEPKHSAAVVSAGAEKDVMYVQEELLKQLNDGEAPAHAAMAGELHKRLRTPKLLLLDDIWTAAQLIGLRGEVVSGSFVIVTTRNTHVLDWHTANVKAFLMPGLEGYDAVSLFRFSAGLEEPPSPSLQELEQEIVNLCGGMPLALAVAGGGLRHKTAVNDWKVIKTALLSGLRITGDGDGRMRALLELSLSGLEFYEKEMFLDACTVMYGRNPDDALCAWGAMHGGRELSGSLDVLRNRSLLEIHKLKEGRGAKDVQVLLMGGLCDMVKVDLDAIFRMAGTQLKWLSLPSFTGPHLPDLAHFKELVILDCSSKMKTLRLRDCWRLSSLPKSLGNLTALTSLDLTQCYSLKSLPESFGNLAALTSLRLHGYNGLRSLPESFSNLTALTSLDLTYCAVLSSLPPSFGSLTALTSLDLSTCHALSSLPASFGNLTSLTSLNLLYCESLVSLPKSFGNLTALTLLNLSACFELSSLSASFSDLTALTLLDLRYCRALSSLPASFGNLTALTSLDLFACESLGSLPESFGNFDSVDLTRLGGSFGNLTALTSLDLSTCRALSSLPASFGNLTALEVLWMHSSSAEVPRNLLDCGLAVLK
ncbi:hypothetical protein JKP88DRAFT_298526 [Tribonema minus]|uniref:NB-ARC domain-containing protein n=1 Tax=Tribonema minus TaxID=303371 RepID=A0A835ZFV0_9STRA|nr:hypothetical protein JKP88DRAFT_298526 [Tribonema minus]